MSFTWLTAGPRIRRASTNRRTREQARRRRSTLESLEDRTVLSTFTWNAASADVWSVASNWTKSNITNGNTIPGATDDVVFDGTSVAASTIDQAFTVKSVTINAGYTGTISANANLTINAGYTQTGGTFNANSSTLTGAPNFTVSGGTFNAGTGTVVFNSGAPVVIAPAVAFNNVTVNTGTMHFRLDTYPSTTGTMTVNGTLDLESFNNLVGTINAKGDVINNVVTTGHSPTSVGTVVFNGTGNQSFTGGTGTV